MKTLSHLFDNNREWARQVTEANPDFFNELANQQAPSILWIGCSDSRVPANQIVDLPPGEVFVHRNIANVVVHSDLNCLSVLQYAVEVLKVKHVIVCGHYGCGGVRASMDGQDHGLIDNWLRHIADVRRFHRDELEGMDFEAEVDRMCELNVFEQVRNVCNTSIVRNSWAGGAELSIHGWIYDVKNGILKDLGHCFTSREEFDAAYPA